MNQAVTTPIDHAKQFLDNVDYHLHYTLGVQPDKASEHDVFTAIALAARNRIIDLGFDTHKRYRERNAKRMYYLSMEFLMGRLLRNNLHNLELEDLAREALQRYNLNLDDVEEIETDAALGNGGLGRLAACFLDSLATLGMPGHGYGINYKYGLFKQYIKDGYQQESPDMWLHEDAPWVIERCHDIISVPVYGRVVDEGEPKQGTYGRWVDWQMITGVPFDMPVVGFGGKTVNNLRLYSARSSNEFDIKIFNGGDYIKAVEQKISSENISKVLYPSDSCWGGKELRLVQEYFLVACALRDIITHHLHDNDGLQNLADQVAIQLNDTHPSLAVPELMRLLMDEYGFDWEHAWDITRETCAYTNHTLLPEALEKWPVKLMEYVLPRHLQIIYEINHRFLQSVRSRWPGDDACLCRLSLIEEGHEQQVRMAHLAIVGSHSVNGVAELHSELVKTRLVPDFHALWPERFNNKTNGVTPRRWVAQANEGLADLLDETIGEQWLTQLDELKKLEQFADDSAFQGRFIAIKQANKQRLADYIYRHQQIRLDVNSMFDIQIKRIHEYKRQLLNIMHVIHQYLEIVENGIDLPVPKTYIFAGKAAPGYVMAKLIIKLINSVGEIVNHDPKVKGQLKVVFMPDYRVSLAEKIIPAANLSEQISTAGTEASGTGNMKFAMNGALTIGTLDGANVEMREEIGAENFFIFGLTTPQVEEMRRLNKYHPWDYYHRSPMIMRVLESLLTERFCPNEPGIFKPIFDMLLNGGDYFYHLADMESYRDTHQLAAQEFTDTPLWTRKAILNVARMGKFSSDRTIQEYARDIWNIEPVL